MRPSLRSIVICSVLICIPALATAQPDTAPHEEFFTARVTAILSQTEEEAFDMKRTVQQVSFTITSGPEKGKVIPLENGALDGREDTLLRQGETVVLTKQITVDGKELYLMKEKYRLPGLGWLVAAFMLLSLLFGGLTGITAIAGLGVSVAILFLYVLPQIASGNDPLAVSLLGSAGIACTSLYLAHGFSKRTSIALLSTMVTLVLAAVLAVIFVYVGKLFGMGSEESLYLQSGLLANVNLRGLLLGGILIGCLGVLDDVTTAQTAAIDEISKANPSLSFAALRKAGTSVGREHIASLINTLALAYAGASLPLLLLLTTANDYPLWVTLNGEFLAEETVRTLVGSSTLLAVPISTWFAAWFLQGGKGGKGSWGHSH